MPRTRIRRIDLNADLGEHDGEGFAGDESLLAVVSSASIACGAHAGSPDVMERTAEHALALGVTIGAHPSYPDREGFGRRAVALETAALVDSVAAQVELLRDRCANAGAKVSYVKLHGALYNAAARDAGLAAAMSACILSLDSGLAVLTLPGCELAVAADRAGLRVVREAFIDRAYRRDGSLLPRDHDGAVLHDIRATAERAVVMASDNIVLSADGETIGVVPDSLCVHGDSANAAEMIRAARARLEHAGFVIRAFA